jgi:hypothetical protein
VAGDIIRTVAISPTFSSIGVLGVIVLIRTSSASLSKWRPKPVGPGNLMTRRGHRTAERELRDGKVPLWFLGCVVRIEQMSPACITGIAQREVGHLWQVDRDGEADADHANVGHLL